MRNVLRTCISKDEKRMIFNELFELETAEFFDLVYNISKSEQFFLNLIIENRWIFLINLYRNKKVLLISRQIPSIIHINSVANLFHNTFCNLFNVIFWKSKSERNRNLDVSQLLLFLLTKMVESKIKNEICILLYGVT